MKARPRRKSGSFNSQVLELLQDDEIDMNQLLERISINPKICFGKPCIKGTRIWVSLLLDMLAAGMSEQEVLESYPHLTHEDIMAAIAYGAEVSRERIVSVPTQAS